MAPSRRKGASKAAAAAAARRKWKVGDLVLAKVKGFPAWPATVSEPQKWGYPADWKKVVVHFFGTEQIAFCNPADVEEFTEEKKTSLLGKRHGKGADFVRAVNEIIDCFEKLKNQDQVSRDNGTEETNITNENDSEEPLTKSVKNEAPIVTIKPLSNGTTNDLNSLTEAAVAAAAEDALQDEEMELAESPASTTCLTRKKTDAAQSRNNGSQRGKSTRRLRSSSRMDVLPSIINSTRNSRRSNANALQDRSLRRSRRIMKSSDDSEGQENDSTEESDSEIMTVDSVTHSMNDGSTVDSGSMPAGKELFAENNEAELSDRLDFQSNTVIIKKKRKPNRKRHNIDTVEAVRVDLVVSDADMLKAESVSRSFSGRSAHRSAKDDGDEHLPLVKRARVRMGRPSSAAEEEATLVNKEEKFFEVPEGPAVQLSEHVTCNVGVPAETGFPVREDPPLSSLPNASPAKKQFWETRKNFVDGEAALPPSKRLHRALEAMSANVAEDCERASSSPQAANIESNGYCPSTFSKCSELSVGKNAVNELGSGAVKGLSDGDSMSSETSGNDAKNIAVVSDCGKSCSADSKNPELPTGSSEHAEGADSKRLKLSPLNELPAEIDAKHHVKLDSVSVDDKLAHLNCNRHDLTNSPERCKTEQLLLNEAANGPDRAMLQMNSDSVEEIAGGSPHDNFIQLDTSDGVEDETHKEKHLLSAEKNQDNKRAKFVEEARPASLDSNNLLSSSPVKVLNNGHQRSLLRSTSISYDHMDDKTVSVTQSSSSLTDGPDSVARASPPGSSICNISASDNNNSLENNSSCSPDVQLHLEKAKLAGKSSNKGECLSSFEAIIKSLTRTKESIGRATRVAIDCAKFGFATKVVEILAHNLESEPSLHKKVDLFFLVDSITQCSRGMKGDGGVYPSAIQALLPRLLLAAAPPGSSSHENHRQCLKVLKVWQERKILPDPIIRHHIRELDALCGSSYPIVGSRRPLRNERAFDDPIRQMEGMQVDEYGSNSSIQLPGFCMPPMLQDEDGGSDSDGESFEAVTPEHNNNVDDLHGEKTLVPEVEKRRHILEDVDGELEMEDVAPCCDVEITSTSNIAGADCTQTSQHQSHNHYGTSFTPQQPNDIPPPPPSAPLPRSPLPLPPPPPPHHPLPPSVFPPDSKPYSSSQESMANHSVLPRVKTTNEDTAHHRVHENKDFEAQVPRRMPDYHDRATSRVNGRASDSIQPNDAYNKGFHLRPPYPAPSNQFSYVQERAQSSRRDNIPPPSHHNRFHSRNAENGNFYRDRDRHKFAPRDNIGERWRPPPSISGPCYPDGPRMDHAPMSYNGPPREPPNNRWNYPPRPMNHRHYNPYRPPSEGPIPVENRGPNFWRPR